MSITAIVENDTIKLPHTTAGEEIEHARLESGEIGGESVLVKSFFGSFSSGEPHGADNERIGRDLERVLNFCRGGRLCDVEPQRI
jgi:hypothetical protein